MRKKSNARCWNELQLQQEDEYFNRVFVFQTAFKGSYISEFENGFSNQKFVGTQKEYDESIKFYDNHSNGKIIGTFKYTLEDWDKMHPPKIEVKETTKKFNRWGEDISEGALNRSNTNRRYWKYL